MPTSTTTLQMCLLFSSALGSSAATENKQGTLSRSLLRGRHRLLSSSSEDYDSEEDWAVNALMLQEAVQRDLTLNDALFVGAHNAYNSWDWDPSKHHTVYFDPNQSLEPEKLLETGVRELSYDTYENEGEYKLCHSSAGVCEGGERKLEEGMEQATGFLDGLEESQKNNTLILIKWEFEDSDIGKLVDVIEEFEDYIYKPEEGHLSFEDDCKGRHGLEPQYLTKSYILDSGKNIVLIKADGEVKDDPCPSDGMHKAYPWFHFGMEYNETAYGGNITWYPKITKGTGDYHLSRNMDTITWSHVYGNQVFNSSETIRNYMNEGLNIIELFNYNGYDQIGNYDECWSADPSDLVWAWDEYYPSSGGSECATVYSDTGRIQNAVSCDDNSLPSACYSSSKDEWKATSTTGAWSAGSQACQDDFGSDFEFSMPETPVQMVSLLDALSDSSSENVWIAYHAGESITNEWEVGYK